MNRKMVIFIAIAVPVVIVLITAIIVITFSINTVHEGKMAVPLNSKNKPVNDKVYKQGTHLISPLYHFSAGLPVKGYPINGGVYSMSSTVNKSATDASPSELSVFIVFRFYVEEKNAYKYFLSIDDNFTAKEYEIESAVNKYATDIVKDVISLWPCDEYIKGYDNNNPRPHEAIWIEKYNKEIQKRFTEKGLLFSLDEEKPIQALLFFDGCGFPVYD